MGSVLFLSREMHKWTFLTPQKEAGPLCGHTRAGCRSPEEADMLSAGGQRAGGAGAARASLCVGQQQRHTLKHTCVRPHTHKCVETHICFSGSRRV